MQTEMHAGASRKTHICTQARARACMHTRMHAFTHARVRMHAHVRMHACMHTTARMGPTAASTHMSCTEPHESALIRLLTHFAILGLLRFGSFGILTVARDTQFYVHNVFGNEILVVVAYPPIIITIMLHLMPGGIHLLVLGPDSGEQHELGRLVCEGWTHIAVLAKTIQVIRMYTITVKVGL